MVNALTTDTTPESRLHALETGPYGRCVYRTDNDVVDHQVVNMAFPSGVTCTLTMQGFSHVEGRTIRIDGTGATLFADSAHNEIRIHDHHTGSDISVGHAEIHQPSRAGSGHGGGDFRIMASFLRTLREGTPPLTTARVSLESHLMAFAAEEARLNQTVVHMAEYKARIEQAALNNVVTA
jgi:predicted dehydrogenase